MAGLLSITNGFKLISALWPVLAKLLLKESRNSIFGLPDISLFTNVLLPVGFIVIDKMEMSRY